jgi:hypothetical protein
MKRAAEEIVGMHARNDFHGAEPVHLVAIYLELHLRVYGVEALDCGSSEQPGAIAAAKHLMNAYFDGSGEAAVEFLRWTWTREAEREKWRKANLREGKRISWRLQFSAPIVTDYRVAQARLKSTGAKK